MSFRLLNKQQQQHKNPLNYSHYFELVATDYAHLLIPPQIFKYYAMNTISVKTGMYVPYRTVISRLVLLRKCFDGILK